MPQLPPLLVAHLEAMAGARRLALRLRRVPPGDGTALLALLHDVRAALLAAPRGVEEGANGEENRWRPAIAARLRVDLLALLAALRDLAESCLDGDAGEGASSLAVPLCLAVLDVAAFLRGFAGAPPPPPATEDLDGGVGQAAVPMDAETRHFVLAVRALAPSLGDVLARLAAARARAMQREMAASRREIGEMWAEELATGEAIGAHVAAHGAPVWGKGTVPPPWTPVDDGNGGPAAVSDVYMAALAHHLAGGNGCRALSVVRQAQQRLAPYRQLVAQQQAADRMEAAPHGAGVRLSSGGPLGTVLVSPGLVAALSLLDSVLLAARAGHEASALASKGDVCFVARKTLHWLHDRHAAAQRTASLPPTLLVAASAVYLRQTLADLAPLLDVAPLAEAAVGLELAALQTVQATTKTALLPLWDAAAKTASQSGGSRSRVSPRTPPFWLEPLRDYLGECEKCIGTGTPPPVWSAVAAAAAACLDDLRSNKAAARALRSSDGVDEACRSISRDFKVAATAVDAIRKACT